METKRASRIEQVFFYLTLLVILAVAQAAAQTYNAELIGQVTDPQGGLIPGANLKATEISRGTTFSTVSTTDGTYDIPGVTPGRYRLEVSKQGFQTALVTDLDLTPLATKRVDVKLQLGAVTQTVQVTDVAAAIETQKATQTTFMPAQLVDMPITNDSRGWVMEALTWLPGSVPGLGWMLFGNAQANQMETTVNGAAVEKYWEVIPENAVREMQVSTSNAPAEFARPTNLNITFKSGTNTYHGDWEWTFDTALLNAVDSPFYTGPRGPSIPDWRTLAGIGGPVRIPHVYDGRDKTFFYFDCHKNVTEYIGGLFPVLTSIPSPQMQAGNFSNYGKIITDPLTGQPFLGNIIPPDRINSVTAAYNNLMYGPAGQGLTYLNNTAYVNNAIGLAWRGKPFDSWMLKVDENLSDRDVVNVLWDHGSEPSTGNAVWLGPYSPRQFTMEPNPHNTYNLGETHTFGPTLFNEFRAAMYRGVDETANAYGDPTKGVITTPGPSGRQWLSTLGIQGISSAPNVPGSSPCFNVGSWPYSWYECNPYANWQTTVQLYDNLSYNHGAHNFKFGWYSIHYAYDDSSTGDFWGTFNFDGRFTGDAFADFLLGYLGTFSKAVPRVWIANRIWDLGAYAEDRWTVSPRLTLDLGLRFSHNTIPNDRNDEYYNFDPNTFQLVVPDQRALSSVSPLWPSATLPVVTAAQAGWPHALFNPHYYWEPRIGFAWRPWGGDRTVIRGGYGLYTGRVLFDQVQTGGPFQVEQTYVNTLGLTGPQYQFPNPFVSAGVVPPVNTATGYVRSFGADVVQQANLTFERMLKGTWGLRATYMFSRTTGMPTLRDINQPMLSTLPFSQDRRPYPAWQSIYLADNGGNDSYHQLDFQITHPFKGGLYLQADYMYRHDRSDVFEDPWGESMSPIQSTYTYNREYDEGPSGYFPTHDVVTNWVWSVPVGTGKRFWSNLSGQGLGGKVLNAVVGGWSASGTFTIHSGLPFNPTYSGYDPGGINEFYGIPDIVPGCDPMKNRSVHGLWFNPSCYTIPKPGTLGDAGRNSLRSPTTEVFVLSPFKEFPLRFSEGAKLRIGANIFNLFNTPAYGYPNTDITISNAGQIASTVAVRGNYTDLGGQRMILLRAEIRF